MPPVWATSCLNAGFSEYRLKPKKKLQDVQKQSLAGSDGDSGDPSDPSRKAKPGDAKESGASETAVSAGCLAIPNHHSRNPPNKQRLPQPGTLPPLVCKRSFAGLSRSTRSIANSSRSQTRQGRRGKGQLSPLLLKVIKGARITCCREDLPRHSTS